MMKRDAELVFEHSLGVLVQSSFRMKISTLSLQKAERQGWGTFRVKMRKIGGASPQAVSAKQIPVNQ